MHQERPGERFPQSIAQAVLKRPWVVLLVVLGFVGPTVGFFLFQPPVNEASAELVASRLVAGQKEEQETSGARLIHPVMIGMDRKDSALVGSRPVAQETIQRLGLRMEPGELLENLAVERVGRIAYVRLSYRNADPRKAKQIVHNVGEVASERISVNDITVAVWPPTVEPTNPVNPALVRSAIVALGLGLMLGIGVALLMEQRAT